MFHLIAQAAPVLKDVADGQVQDSKVLGEQFYFFTVVLMWLIHAGFMSYEAGVARRKNVMATAMKNILTIAVVTPTFYYFGWMIYNCAQPGLPITPSSDDFTAVACAGGIPWSIFDHRPLDQPVRQRHQVSQHILDAVDEPCLDLVSVVRQPRHPT